MAMDERIWRRHANPLSVWTRIPIAPLLVLSIYARIWIGWQCLIPIGILILWTWLNPRAFPEPKRFTSWSSRGVFGERLFLNRRNVPIPNHQRAAALRLAVVSALGVPPTIYGLIVLDPWATAFGTSLIMLGKLWFVDRMAWLYDEMGQPYSS